MWWLDKNSLPDNCGTSTELPVRARMSRIPGIMAKDHGGPDGSESLSAVANVRQASNRQQATPGSGGRPRSGGVRRVTEGEGRGNESPPGRCRGAEKLVREQTRLRHQLKAQADQRETSHQQQLAQLREDYEHRLSQQRKEHHAETEDLLERLAVTGRRRREETAWAREGAVEIRRLQAQLQSTEGQLADRELEIQECLGRRDALESRMERRKTELHEAMNQIVTRAAENQALRQRLARMETERDAFEAVTKRQVEERDRLESDLRRSESEQVSGMERLRTKNAQLTKAFNQRVQERAGVGCRGGGSTNSAGGRGRGTPPRAA